MLIAVERLLLKIRQPRSRADELIELRRRARAELATEPSPDELRLAADVRRAKLAVTDAFNSVAIASCRSCAKGAPLPRGRYDGGDCCAGVTNDLFEERELAALVHAGTRPSDFTPPPRNEDHAGCTFRGAHGCSLELEHRPARCVHYVCDTLRRELYDHKLLDDVEAKLAELSATMGEFSRVHRERTDRDVLAPLIEALETHRRTT